MENEEFLKRFWSKVDKTGTCWIWTGAPGGNGYGLIASGGKMLYVHRISLELYLGRPVGKGLVVAHEPIACHNRLCVNPLHLREATYSENAFDKNLDGTMTRVFGEASRKPRLFTAEQIRAIRVDTRTHHLIAEDYGVHRKTIGKITTRKAYAWVD